MTATETAGPTRPLKWVGRSMRRVEDPKLLTGSGKFIDDITFPGMLHAAVLRSPYAHARIISVDAEAARRLPGVVAVVTGPEALELLNPLMENGPAPDKYSWRALAADKVRHVGEGVAVVAATSRYIAEDALELIEVEYEPLEPVVDPFRAMEPGTPLVHEQMPQNLGCNRTLSFGDVAGDFASADVIVTDQLRWRRHGAQPLETLGTIGVYDRGTGMVTVHANAMGPTWMSITLAGTLKIPPNRIDIRPYLSGGSFGSKFMTYKPMALVGMLTMLTGRPVKYIEDRIDNMTNGDQHASDRTYEIALALTADGIMKSVKIDVVDDYGAYMQYGVGTHGNAMAHPVGPYRMQSIEYRLRAVYTNKCQQGGYRGFGSEVMNWALERIVDKAARDMDMDPVDLRRKNLIQPDQFPYTIPTGNLYDSGDYERVLDHALDLAEYKYWREEQARARAEGRHVGIGLVTCQERSVFGATEFWFWFDNPAVEMSSMPESATVSVDATGSITVTLYSASLWGQGAETMAAMLVAEELDVDPESVAIVTHGSSGALPGTGPGGSRYTVMVAGAIHGSAEKIKAKANRIAAHLLECDGSDLEWVDGGFQIKGSPGARLSLGQIAGAAYFLKHSLPEDIESGLEGSQVYDHPKTVLPAADRSDLGVFYPCMGHACHISVVEVDVETGAVTHLKYVAVHDAGTIVNPRSLDGQIVGGTAQGVGTALLEEFVYDDQGQFLTGSFMDFLMPTAMEVPEVTIGHEQTPSPFTVHGIKGGGEAGRMMAPGAISAAIDDALSDLGVRVTGLPASPARIKEWIDAAAAERA